MYWRDNGFFMLEQLLSLSILLLVSLFMLPLLIDIRNQYRQIDAVNYARQLVYQELQGQFTDGGATSDYSIFLNGLEYRINWKNSAATGESEVCVSVDKDSAKIHANICATPE